MSTNQPVNNIAGAGVDLAFVIYPTAIANFTEGIVFQFFLVLTFGILSVIITYGKLSVIDL